MTSYKELIERAKEASQKAYAPYSNFKVGACVLSEDGNLYSGCNFENASYGLSICAERNAIGSMVANGETKIKAIAIYSPNMYNCTPCGFLLNIIPALISKKCQKSEIKKPLENKLIEEKEKEKENINFIEYIYNNPYDKYLSTKDFIKFIIICIFLFLNDFIDTSISVINIEKNNNATTNKENNYTLIDKYYFLYNNNTSDNKTNVTKNEYEYEDEYLFLEFLMIFFLAKFTLKTNYYKHQNISFLILFLMEICKSLYFFFINKMKLDKFKWMNIIFNIISAVIYSCYYSYISGLMKYKFVSPYKVCYMIGMINVPLIILINIAFLFSDKEIFQCSGDENDKNYYCLNLFKSFRLPFLFNYIQIISLVFCYTILMALFIKTINEFTLYHIYVPLLVENFLKNFFLYWGDQEHIINIILLSVSFVIELIMILVFLEIIELKFWGLNKNLKKNIELRSITDSAIYDDDDDEYDDDERHTMRNNSNIIN